MKAGDLDVSNLPDFAFGHRSMVWWGTLGFVVIEAMVFAILIVSYLYGVTQEPEWPPRDKAPGLILGTLNTVILLVSCWPNHKYKVAAEALDERRAKLWLWIALLFGIAFVVVRGFEFALLNVRWDENFFGSILWMMLGFHTAHLLTDVADTIVLGILTLKEPMTGKRFSDLSDNGMYWYFVVVAWLPFYFLIYVLPRVD